VLFVGYFNQPLHSYALPFKILKPFIVEKTVVIPIPELKPYSEGTPPETVSF